MNNELSEDYMVYSNMTDQERGEVLGRIHAKVLAGNLSPLENATTLRFVLEMLQHTFRRVVALEQKQP